MNKLSTNLMAKRYLEIKAQIDTLTEEQNQVKAFLKEVGQFEDEEVVIKTSEFDVERMAGVEACVEKLGRKVLKGLISKTSQSRIDVKLKRVIDKAQVS